MTRKSLEVIEQNKYASKQVSDEMKSIIWKIDVNSDYFTKEEDTVVKKNQWAKWIPNKNKWPRRRWRVDDPIMHAKLEMLAAAGLSVYHSCIITWIQRETYQEIMKKYPELKTKLEDLRQVPLIKAKLRVELEAHKDFDKALKLLERKMPEEYAPKSIERIESVNKNVNVETTQEQLNEKDLLLLNSALAD